MTTYALTPDAPVDRRGEWSRTIQYAALNAISSRIDELRDIANKAARAGDPALQPGTRADAARVAVFQALELRQLELAAWRMGENLDRNLPAVYRTPKVHQP